MKMLADKLENYPWSLVFLEKNKIMIFVSLIQDL